MKKSEISWGGFFPDNIRNWIIKECRESGDPVNFFRVVDEVVESMVDAGAGDDEFWENETQQ